MYDGFEDVNQSHSPLLMRRTSTYVDVETSGYAKTGVEGRDKIDYLLSKSGIPREEAVFHYRANVAKKQVAVRVAKAGTAGQGPFKRQKKGYSFHLGGVFAQYPSLRPLTASKCQMFWGPDGKALIIDLATGTSIVRQSRKKKTTNGEEGQSEEE
ncbi:MAG TPA: hypothetical protein VD973_08800 [Symbiobacteriaceae bacterium]|nr:hypothetical protein [Symbiobacteriaceae bacterium]